MGYTELKFFRVPLPALSDKAMIKVARRSNDNIPSFFRILLQDFAQKLWIPHAFLKHVTNERLNGKATLVDPNGKSYQIYVYSDVEGKYFGGDGWAEFLRAHNLGLGCFLLFRYRGNMVFDFCAYDLTTCEIAYPSASPRKARVSQTLKQEADQKMKRPVGRPRKQEVNMSTPAKIRTCTVQCFEAQIRPYNLIRPFMHIPVKIMTEFSELQSQKEIILKDPDDRSWNVRVSHRKQRLHTIYSLTTGWLQFVQGNNLKKDDKCAFQIVTESEESGKMMIVQIIRQCECR